MADDLQIPGGSASTESQYVGPVRAIRVDKDNWEIQIHDGATPVVKFAELQSRKSRNLQTKNTELNGFTGLRQHCYCAWHQQPPLVASFRIASSIAPSESGNDVVVLRDVTAGQRAPASSNLQRGRRTRPLRRAARRGVPPGLRAPPGVDRSVTTSGTLRRPLRSVHATCRRVPRARREAASARPQGAPPASHLGERRTGGDAPGDDVLAERGVDRIARCARTNHDCRLHECIQDRPRA